MTGRKKGVHFFGKGYCEKCSEVPYTYLWGGEEGVGTLCSGLGLAISDKKIIPRKTEKAKKLVYSDGIPTVPRNAKISEFRSEPIPRKRKMLGIPNRGTKLKQNSRNFVPNPFRGREKCSEFRSVEHGL